MEASLQVRPERVGPGRQLRHVLQEDPYGCGVACAAMIAGVTYREARAVFVQVCSTGERRISLEGILDVQMDALLTELGYAVARFWRGARNVRPEWPPPLTAGVYLLQESRPSGGHFSILLNDGTLLDPAVPECAREVDWAFVYSVTAIVPIHA